MGAGSEDAVGAVLQPVVGGGKGVKQLHRSAAGLLAITSIRPCSLDYSSVLPCFSLEERVDHSANCKHRVTEKETCEAFFLKGKESSYPCTVAMALRKQREKHSTTRAWREMQQWGEDKRHRGFTPRVGSRQEGKLSKVAGAGSMGKGKRSELLRKRFLPNPYSFSTPLVDQGSYGIVSRKIKIKTHQVSEVLYITLEYF